MQGLAVAISPSGVAFVISQLLGSQIANGLKTNMTEPPDCTIDNIPGWSQSGHGTTESWSNYVLTLSEGQFTDFAPAYSGYQQANPSGQTCQFSVTVDAPNCSVTYDWVESYTQTVFPAPPFENGTKSVGPNSPPYLYTQSFQSFNVTVVFVLGYSSSAANYEFTWVSNSTSIEGETATIPSKSVLNDQVTSGCFSSNVSTQTDDQLEMLDYAGAVTGIVSTMMGTIPASGELDGGAVTFDFGPSSSTGLGFPSGGGVTAGVTGDVSANGATYSSTVTVPADVIVPTIPGDPWWDVAYNIQDYEINALYWGYYSGGDLTRTLTEADFNNGVGGPSNPLYTSYYAHAGPLSVIDTTYPNQPMNALLTPQAAPTVTFQTIYALTPTNATAIIAQLQSEGVLTSTMSTALTAMGTDGFIYVGEDAFNDWVIGQCADLQPYLTTIVDPAAASPGVVLNVSVECVLSIPGAPGSPTILTWSVAENFILQDLVLGPLDDTIQSLSGTLAGSTDQTMTLTPISTTLGSAVEDNLWTVWAFLETPWQELLQYVATQGVPVPCIAGFEITPSSSDASQSPPPVTINVATSSADGYVAVLATIQASS